ARGARPIPLPSQGRVGRLPVGWDRRSYRGPIGKVERDRLRRNPFELGGLSCRAGALEQRGHAAAPTSRPAAQSAAAAEIRSRLTAQRCGGSAGCAFPSISRFYCRRRRGDSITCHQSTWTSLSSGLLFLSGSVNSGLSSPLVMSLCARFFARASFALRRTSSNFPIVAAACVSRLLPTDLADGGRYEGSQFVVR